LKSHLKNTQATSEDKLGFFVVDFLSQVSGKKKLTVITELNIKAKMGIK
jgi:hypothetical protein